MIASLPLLIGAAPGGPVLGPIRMPPGRDMGENSDVPLTMTMTISLDCGE